MTMFANCREKFTKKTYPMGTQFRKNEDIPEDEINPYWEGNLKGEDKAEVYGYDFAADTADNFFANLDVNDFLAKYLTQEELLQVSEIAGEMMQDEEEINEEKFREKTAECSRIVKAILALRLDLADWLEMERDQFITSLLDNQSCEDETQEEES